MAELTAGLVIKKRYRLQTPEPHLCHIVLVGCGGTGSFLALHLARLAYHVREKTGNALKLTFVDPDMVEARNIGRQNFAPAEIGRFKAQTLAWRFNMAFGLNITALAERFDPAMVNYDALHGSFGHGGWFLVVGAVDNAAARKEIDAAARRYDHVKWLDSGNHEHSGQLLLGDRGDLEAPRISPLGFCSGLPLPSVQHPELVQSPRSEVESPQMESCAELTVREVQGLMVNQAMATYAAQYAYRLLVTQDLDIYQTYVDLVTGSARSTGITEG